MTTHEWTEDLRGICEAFLQAISELHGRGRPDCVSKLAAAVRDVIAVQERVMRKLERTVRRERRIRVEIEERVRGIEKGEGGWRGAIERKLGEIEQDGMRVRVLEERVKEREKLEREWREGFEERIVGVERGEVDWRRAIEEKIRAIEKRDGMERNKNPIGRATTELQKRHDHEAGKEVRIGDRWRMELARKTRGIETRTKAARAESLENRDGVDGVKCGGDHGGKLSSNGDDIEIKRTSKRRRVDWDTKAESFQKHDTVDVVAGGSPNEEDNENGTECEARDQVEVEDPNPVVQVRKGTEEADMNNGEHRRGIHSSHSRRGTADDGAEQVEKPVEEAAMQDGELWASLPSPPLPALPSVQEVVAVYREKQRERRQRKREREWDMRLPCAKCRLRKRALMLRDGGVDERVFERWENKRGNCFGNVHQDEEPEEEASGFSFEETETQRPE